MEKGNGKLGQKIFFVIFTFQDLTRNFQPKKRKKHFFYQNFWNFNAPQIAQIQNFEILISRDDEYYLEDSFLKNSASR